MKKENEAMRKENETMRKENDTLFSTPTKVMDNSNKDTIKRNPNNKGKTNVINTNRSLNYKKDTFEWSFVGYKLDNENLHENFLDFVESIYGYQRKKRQEIIKDWFNNLNRRNQWNVHYSEIQAKVLLNLALLSYLTELAYYFNDKNDDKQANEVLDVLYPQDKVDEIFKIFSSGSISHSSNNHPNPFNVLEVNRLFMSDKMNTEKNKSLISTVIICFNRPEYYKGIRTPDKLNTIWDNVMNKSFKELTDYINKQLLITHFSPKAKDNPPGITLLGDTTTTTTTTKNTGDYKLSGNMLNNSDLNTDSDSDL